MQTDDLTRQFLLLNKLLVPPDNSIIDKWFSPIKKVIYDGIPEMLKKNAPPESFDLYSDFKALYEEFYNFVSYDKLIGKSVVALGGRFSSGKSTFLNTLINDDDLPTDIEASTAVLTFIVHSDTDEAFGINTFKAKTPIEMDDVRSISYGFGEIRDENGYIESPPMKVGHLLKSLFLATPRQNYANLAFVDTPGFSNTASEKYSIKTDENLSREQLNTSSYIIMFVQAETGGLTEDDIRFIKSLRADIPKLFIVSKADRKTKTQLKNIVTHIQSQLTKSQIKFIDVLTFSRDDTSAYDSNAIQEVLSEWNDAHAIPQFSKNFKELFISCRVYYQNGADYHEHCLKQLNSVLTLLNNENEKIVSPLQDLVNDAQENIKKFSTSLDELKELNKEFFTGLKDICDKVGISMPEPSERDMLEDKDIPNLQALLKAYKIEHGLKTNRGDVSRLKEAFKDITPALAMGSIHNERFMEIIRENCRVAPESIRINDAVSMER